ncbi:hypothetical protein [Mucilaginibacter myungsuensis]|uniref:Uncharacterized protein n=1 Tax=Mucilaginibacter myungsuensis TaxID=649104 RepID=A0A929KY13_9SPHI|nr:hypothetical protein [Mucilaginibacter myungsuensis]MBE9663761.1 hypothetical protein [Mucilaginibacter myungsuensis]
MRTLQRIESGEVTPRSYTIKLIFAALGIDVFDKEVDLTNGLPGTGSPAKQRLHMFYAYLIDLFNFKTNAMKKLTILSFFFLTLCTLIFTACLSTKSTVSKNTDLVGTWQLMRNGVVDTNYGGQNGLIRYKIITAERFTVTDVMPKSKSMWAAFSGPYWLDKQKGSYVELIEIAGEGYQKYNDGTKGVYEYSIQDSVWHVKGVNVPYDEYWKRVK